MPAKPKTARVRKKPEYKSFRLAKRIKHPVELPAALTIFWRSLKPLKQRWKLFSGILLIYLILSLLLVKQFAAQFHLNELKLTLQALAQGSKTQLDIGWSLFKTLLTSTGATPNEAAGVYQLVIGLVISLALIWALRQAYAVKDTVKLRIRDAFYGGMYPLVQFLLVLVVIGLEFIPLILGGFLYSLVVDANIAANGAEKFTWLLIFFLLALLSLYLVASSIFALYIVTLPNMTPLKALRSARELVRYRRWTVLRKILLLPAALFVVTVVIEMPVLLWLTPVAEWVFFGLTLAALALLHSYLYGLYRELL